MLSELTDSGCALLTAVRDRQPLDLHASTVRDVLNRSAMVTQQDIQGHSTGQPESLNRSDKVTQQVSQGHSMLASTGQPRLLNISKIIQ